VATEVGRAYVTLEARIKDLESGLARANASVNAFATHADRSSSQVSSKFAQMGATMSAIGKKMTTRVTLPIVGLGAAGMKMSNDFGKSMAKIQGLVGVAANDVRKLETGVKRMSAQYGVSASESADAMFFITSAGLRGADAMNVLEASSKASIAGLGETKTIADLVTSAVNAYGTETLSASSATDILTAAVREGKLEATELAGSMGRVLPVASGMGVGLEEVGAAFAALSRTGTGAAEASTQIRGILFSLLKPSGDANKQLQELGLSAGGLRKQIREKGLLDTLRTLTESFGDNEEAQGRVFGNVRALSGLMDLFGGSVATTEKIFRSMANTTGATDAAFAAVAQTAGYKMQKAFNDAKLALMEFGAIVAPFVANIASGFARVAQAINALPGPIKNVVAAFATLLAVAGPVLLVGGKMVTMFSKFGGAAAKVGAGAMGLKTGTAAVAGFGGAAGGAATKVGLFARMLPFAANPLGALTLAVGAGVAALFLFRERASSGERALEGLAEVATTARTQIAMLDEQFKTTLASIDLVKGATDKSSAAQKNYERATNAVTAAINNGRRAGESKAQFESRLASLQATAATAQANVAKTQAMTTGEIMRALPAVAKLTDAGKEEVRIQQERVQKAKLMTSALNMAGKTESEQMQIRANLSEATADLQLAELSRKDALREGLRAQRDMHAAVKNSTMSDSDKRTVLDILNRSMNRTQRELKGISSTPGIVKIEAETATSTLNGIFGRLGELAGKVVTSTVRVVEEVVRKFTGGKKPPATGGGFRGGFVRPAGFATGGVVNGPNGRDRVPAMLTAGEVVLTKRQQSMVNGGMSIRDAISRTGGLMLNKGGGFKFRKQKKGETNDAYKKAKAAAKKQWVEQGASTLEAEFGKATAAFTSLGLAKFDEDARARMKEVERTFVGTGAVIGKTFGSIDDSLANDLKSIERDFKGTFTVMGQTSVGGFRVFEKASRAAWREFGKQQRTAQNQLAATFDALTPAEARLKSLQDEASQGDLTSNLQEAREQFAEASKWGDPKAVADARKQLAEAERAVAISELQKTAEEQRAQREQERQTAQDDFDADWEERRAALSDTLSDEQAMLQQQLDDKLAARRTAAETERTLLQQQLDDTLARQQAADDMARVQREHQLQDEAAMFMRKRNLYRGNHNSILASIRTFTRKMEISGKNIGAALSNGLVDAGIVIKARSAELAKIIADYLKTASPTKKGPMSDLDKWWDGFAPALLEGMDASKIEGAVALATSPGSMGSKPGAAGGGGLTINMTVTDQTFAGMSREQADRVARDIKAALDRQVTFAL